MRWFEVNCQLDNDGLPRSKHSKHVEFKLHSKAIISNEYIQAQQIHSRKIMTHAQADRAKHGGIPWWTERSEQNRGARGIQRSESCTQSPTTNTSYTKLMHLQAYLVVSSRIIVWQPCGTMQKHNKAGMCHNWSHAEEKNCQQVLRAWYQRGRHLCVHCGWRSVEKSGLDVINRVKGLCKWQH